MQKPTYTTIQPPTTLLLREENGVQVYEKLYLAYLRITSKCAVAPPVSNEARRYLNPLYMTGGADPEFINGTHNTNNTHTKGEKLTEVTQNTAAEEEPSRTARPIVCTMCNVAFPSRNTFKRHHPLCDQRFRNFKAEAMKKKKDALRMAKYKERKLNEKQKKKQPEMSGGLPVIHGPLKPDYSKNIPAPPGATKLLVKSHHLTRESYNAKLVGEELKTGRFYTSPDLTFSLAAALNAPLVYNASALGKHRGLSSYEPYTNTSSPIPEYKPPIDITWDTPAPVSIRSEEQVRLQQEADRISLLPSGSASTTRHVRSMSVSKDYSEQALFQSDSD